MGWARGGVGGHEAFIAVMGMDCSRPGEGPRKVPSNGRCKSPRRVVLIRDPRPPQNKKVVFLVVSL